MSGKRGRPRKPLKDQQRCQVILTMTPGERERLGVLADGQFRSMNSQVRWMLNTHPMWKEDSCADGS
jgi:hypothetical protein